MQDHCFGGFTGEALPTGLWTNLLTTPQSDAPTLGDEIAFWCENSAVLRSGDDATEHHSKATKQVPVVRHTKHLDGVVRQNQDGAEAEKPEHHDRNPHW